MFDLDATIVAISTPPGRGGIGVVRLSGDNALTIAQRLFVATKYGDLTQVASHQMVYGWVQNGEQKVDEGYAVYLKSPNSFTGEDVVELQIHGSPQALRATVELCLQHGARLAEAGEFSRRALIHGKIDLSQAEAIIDLIDAKTSTTAQLAATTLSGNLGSKIREIRQRLNFWFTHVEALLDFPEDQIPEIDEHELKSEIAAANTDLLSMLAASAHAWVYREGLKVALVGEPNMGKSSLFNALLGHDRAIVSEISGTTRDVIEETLDVQGVPVVLSDTAGITCSEDKLEQMSVERSIRAIRAAEVLLLVLDATDETATLERFLATVSPAIKTEFLSKKRILVSNKCDQLSPTHISPRADCVLVSAQSLQGIAELKQRIVADYLLQPLAREAIIVTNLRQIEALRHAQVALDRILQNFALGLGMDVQAHELHEGIAALGEITGDNVDDALHAQIFGRFCIGK